MRNGAFLVETRSAGAGPVPRPVFLVYPIGQTSMIGKRTLPAIGPGKLGEGRGTP